MCSYSRDNTYIYPAWAYLPILYNKQNNTPPTRQTIITLTTYIWTEQSWFTHVIAIPWGIVAGL